MALSTSAQYESFYQGSIEANRESMRDMKDKTINGDSYEAAVFKFLTHRRKPFDRYAAAAWPQGGVDTIRDQHPIIDLKDMRHGDILEKGRENKQGIHRMVCRGNHGFGDREEYIHVKGESSVYRYCAEILLDGQVQKMTEEHRRGIQNTVAYFERQGEKVFTFARVQDAGKV